MTDERRREMWRNASKRYRKSHPYRVYQSSKKYFDEHRAERIKKLIEWESTHKAQREFARKKWIQENEKRYRKVTRVRARTYSRILLKDKCEICGEEKHKNIIIPIIQNLTL